MAKYLIVLVSLTTFLVTGCNTSGDARTPAKTAKKSELRILHAGSLSIPFKEVAKAFMSKYPQYDVLLESHGSRTCARQISQLGRPADVMGSADSQVIRDMLMPQHAGYCIDFATNEMVIMYNEKSKYNDTIHQSNWYQILLKPGVQYGHSEPNSDPCGYRTLFTWQLAQKYYNSPNLYHRLREKMPKRNLRPKAVDLIALLDAGELDYIFIYRSVAEQHRSPFLVLPDEINLKSTQNAGFYQTATVKLTGKKPGQWVEQKGAPMVYGVTVPKNAPNPEGGTRFVAFLLAEEGRQIMKNNGQPPIHPPHIDHKEQLPLRLQSIFQ
ncbi:MAG: tungstate ABC transporter substrate-binding protein WtpA [bacterium]|nr:tungstate ABC transporter substrate-binding protein WtpA [bacterium]